MEAQRFDLLTLALLPGLAPPVMAPLLRRADLPAVLRHPRKDELPEASRRALRSGEARRSAEEQLRLAEKARVRMVFWGEADYPPLLARIFDPPAVLWVRGVLPSEEPPGSLAVVGSRQATPAGRVLARALARDLARAGATIVSGLALGIDGEAHRGALEGGGATVAVLGGGVDRVYPAAHQALAEAVQASGALVSEFALGVRPTKASFPRRNRIIAGWGSGVVVVEAAARSGALVTARVALDEGREVMAVPGPPSLPTAEGTNALIREGAALVRDARDVAAELGWRLDASAPAAAGEPVLHALRADAPLGLDQLQQRCGLPVSDLLRRLTQLELERKVERLPGALFVRSAL